MMEDSASGARKGLAGLFRIGATDARLVSMALILVAMWLFFRLQVGSFYFSGESIAKLSRDMATWAILASGMTLVIVCGCIDLSVGSLLAFSAAVCAFLMDPETGLGQPALVAVPPAVAVAALLGFIQGSLVAWCRIPSFIVTLGGMFVFRGLTQKVSAKDPRIPDASWVNALGFSYVPPGAGLFLAAAAVGGMAAWAVHEARRRERLGMPPGWAGVAIEVSAVAALLFGFVFKVNQYRGIPAQTLAMAVCMLIVGFIAKRTVFGRRVFAVGGNAEAAKLSGIRVEMVTVSVFTLMGFLAGIAGVVWMAQNQGATQKAGEWYELYAVAACVIGGTSLLGGRGSVAGSFMGALIMATVVQGMDYLGLENWLQLVVRGSVLVLAVGLDMAGRSPPAWLRRRKVSSSFS